MVESMILKLSWKIDTHLAPLKRVTNESNVVTHNAIRPGTFLCGIKTEAAEA